MSIGEVTPSDYQKYRGKCLDFCYEEIAKDSSLTLTRGFYYCLFWGEQQHWWLTRSDGSILDPTKDQFPSKGLGEYVPIPEGGLVIPCETCGKEIEEKNFIVMGNYVVCSDSCARILVGV